MDIISCIRKRGHEHGVIAGNGLGVALHELRRKLDDFFKLRLWPSPKRLFGFSQKIRIKDKFARRSDGEFVFGFGVE